MGFYVCPVDDKSQPNAAFYVKGQGYKMWCRMLFRFTGALTRFHGVTSRALGDMVGTNLELFTDDGGIANKTIDEGITTLHKLLNRVRSERLSLSPQKTELFRNKVVFAGEQVGQMRICPDLAKLTVVVN